MSHALQEIQFVVLYKRPNMSNHDFTRLMDRELRPHLDASKPLVIIGDFNLDINGKHRTLTQKLCETFSCKMLINEPTTDNNTVLDLVFTNIDGVAGTIETYWSDHKIVTFHTKHLP